MTAVTGRRTFAAQRWAVSTFCWMTAGYAFMSASPFVYRQFLAPRVFQWPGVFSEWHTILYWMWLALVLLQVGATVRTRGPARVLALLFAATWTAVGVAVTISPILPRLVDDRRSACIGLLALAPILWLAVIDHVRHHGLQADGPVNPDDARLLVAATGTAVFVTIIYAMLTPIATAGQFEPDLLTEGLAAGFAWNLIDHLLIFCAVFLVLALVDRSCLRAGFRARYAASLVLFTVMLSLVTEKTVSEPLGLSGAWAVMVSLASGMSIVAMWSSLRLRRWADESVPPASPLELLFGPPAGGRLTVRRLVPFAVLALAAYGVGAVSRIVDWDFLLLKAGLFAVWIAAFGQAFRMAPRRLRISSAVVVVVCIFPLGAYVAAGALPRWVPRHALDRYKVYNPSFRVADDLLRDATAEDDPFQRFLRENSGLGGQVDASPVSIDLAALDERAPGPRPFVFLFVIDSLRRDYLRPYNRSVGFTPNIARFADESLVFQNAFTAFGGTGLSVPAIWSGSVGVHKQYVLPFAPMNALDKLLQVNGYRKFLSLDSIVRQLLPLSQDTLELDYGFRNEEFRFCRTLAELQTRLAGPRDDSRPVFAYTLPQDLHVSNIITASVPAGETYPGFHAPYASRVHRIDACFGEFVDFLKHRGWYDSSVIVVTADHGEMLGEDGLWGHVYYLFPPVLQVPLIIHLPAGAAREGPVDLDAVSLTTDIAPTIYSALGYEPRRSMRLMGRSLIGPGDQATAARRERFVTAASYSAVYGALASNGRQLYIVDAVQHREYVYVRGASNAWSAVPVTEGIRESGQRLIREHIRDINRVYQVRVH